MDRYAFDTMKNGYNRYQVEDYIQTQKLQMERKNWKKPTY